MLRSLLCRLGYHHRSGTRLFRGSDGAMKSHCRGCDALMTRDSETGKWSLVESADTGDTTRLVKLA